jgi:hypothetical protein
VPYKDIERRRATRRTYYAANRQKFVAERAAHHAANTEKERARGREHYRQNKEKKLAANREWHEKNKAKHAVLNRNWALANKEKIAKSRDLHGKERDFLSKRIRGRTQEILAGRSKPDCCDVCGATGRRIDWDHSHQRGHFRGWLCNRCNAALGMVNDDVNVLRKLIAYLERSQENTSPQLTFPGV